MKGEGRWTLKEHSLFLEAIICFKNWKNVASHVKTRNVSQCRSHNQKMLFKKGKANLRLNQPQQRSRNSNKRDASTQWEDCMPAFETEKIMDILNSCDSTTQSILSTGDESPSSNYESDYSEDLIFNTAFGSFLTDLQSYHI